MSENYWGKNAIELHFADCKHTRLFHAVTPQITSTATDAILNWRRCRYPDAARLASSNVSASVVQQRQRERLKIELADSFGVARTGLQQGLCLALPQHHFSQPHRFHEAFRGIEQ